MQFIFREKPHIDLKFCFVIANNCDFRGSGLDKMAGKEQDGSYVNQWYENKEYSFIEDYIKQEAKSFLKVFSVIREDLIKTKHKWKE